MKHYVLGAATVIGVLLVLIACTPSNANDISSQQSENEMMADTSDARVQSGSGINCSINGNISHETWNKDESSIVTFSRFPSSLDEFNQAREQLGTEPQGAVALQIMAFELYRRDAEAGTRALELNNTMTNYTQTLRQLKEIMNVKDAYYARPYISAALLKGANPDNDYRPKTPYQVCIRVNPANKYQESEFLNGTVIYLQVDSEGWDTNWRGVEVVRSEGSDYYVVSNCPALYTQCKKIKGTWKGLE